MIKIAAEGRWKEFEYIFFYRTLEGRSEQADLLEKLGVLEAIPLPGNFRTIWTLGFGKARKLLKIIESISIVG